MRNSHLAIVLGVWLALAACSKATTDKTGDDLKSVGHDAAAAAKDVANAPAAKELGSDIKQGTEEAAAKTKVAADEAGEKLKAEGASTRATRPTAAPEQGQGRRVRRSRCASPASIPRVMGGGSVRSIRDEGGGCPLRGQTGGLQSPSQLSRTAPSGGASGRLRLLLDLLRPSLPVRALSGVT